MKLSRRKFGNIPQELKDRPQWVNSGIDRGTESPNKIPYDPKTGKPAKANDPSTWGTYKAARDRYVKGLASGIGFEFSEDDPYCGIDYDHCVDEQRNIDPAVMANLKEFNSYAEFSPSHTGVHIICRGKLPKGGCKKNGIEMYDQGRYFRMTGDVIQPFTEIRNCQLQINLLHEKVFGGNNAIDDEILNKAKSANNGDLFQRLWSRDLYGYDSPSEADMALCDILSFWSKGDAGTIERLFRQSKLMRPKWDKRHYADGNTYGEETIRKAIEATRDSYNKDNPDYLAADAGISPDEQKQNSELLKFPDIMDGVAGEFADLYSSYLEPPAHFFYLSFLTCLGTILADRVRLVSELSVQPRLYTIILGESADDRKSTAIDKTIQFFKSSQTAFPVCYGINSAEGLQKVLLASPTRLLIFDEFKQFVTKCRIDNSVLITCVNSLFEQNHCESQTKKESIVIENAYLSILAASTLETYERIWDASFTDIGFTNRLFLVPGKGVRRFSLPEKIPQSEIDKCQKGLSEIMSFVDRECSELEMTRRARELYDEWYMSIKPSIHSKRLDTYAMRFMLLLAVNEKRNRIDSRVVEKVIKLIEWQLAVRKIHDPINADSKIAKMEEKIRRVLSTGPKTERKLRQFTNADRAGLYNFRYALKNLETAGDIKRDEIEKEKWLKV